MGNKGPKEENSEIQEDYEAVVNHPKIGNVTIKRTNKNHQYMETNFPILDKKDYDTWVKGLKSSPGEKTEFALHPRKHEMKKETTCGKSGTAKIQYENYSYTLRDQIRNRQKAGHKQFQENELWYLIFALSNAAEKFHENKEKLGDIRPENVFINNEGQIKASTRDSWPKENTNYEKYFYDHEPTLLAPEQINDVQVGRNSPTSDLVYAESFSLGMTALDSILLDDSERMYSKNGFNYEVLDQKRSELMRDPKYSQILKIVVSNLTSPQFGKRISAKQLQEFLQPNAEKIKNFSDFSVSGIPYKLEQTAEENKSSAQRVSYSQKQPVQVQYIPSKTYSQSVNYRVSSDEPSKYRMTLAEVEQKVAKSRAMHP